MTARTYEVEVVVTVTIDGDEEAAYAAVDEMMRTGTVQQYALLEECVTDVTEEDPCTAAGEHQTGSDHRWQECPVYHTHP